MATPRQMTANTLEALKGWPSQHAVDFSTQLAAAVTIDPVPPGRVAHLNSAGKYELGMPDFAPADKKIAMPIFLFPSSDDPDVANPGGITGSVGDSPNGWMAIGPRKNIVGLVAAGAYELESTEFKSDDLFPPNASLTATASNTDAATGGVLKLGTPYTDAICGIVSRGVRKNHHGVNALAFWPYVLPASS